MESSRDNGAASEPDQDQPGNPPIEPNDSEIDSIIKLLDSSLNLQTRAIAASRRIRVSDKYSLVVETTPSQFYKIRAEYRRIDKRKRDQGILPKSTKGQRIGFRPEELLWNGALDMRNCRPSDLSYEIHPLFGPDRFDDCPDFIYEQFKPALQLATIFLTKPICLQFWVTLALGDRKIDSAESEKWGFDTERIEKNVPMTKANTSQIAEYIKSLDQATLVHFSFKHAMSYKNIHVWGAAQQVCDHYVERPRGPFSAIRRHSVRLHGDFYVAARRMAQLTYRDIAQHLRFSLFLAVTLVHEMAHVIEGAHDLVRPGWIPKGEPFLFDHGVMEMGAAWESMMFGGRIQPINGRVDGSHGLCVYDWPGDDQEYKPADGKVYYSIPMGYVESMFQMKNWQRDYSLKGWKRFHISHGGARAIYMSAFTTMPWNEEMHEIEVGLAEDLNLHDPDEPARKRRETRTGSAVISTKGYGEELEKDRHEEDKQYGTRYRPGIKRPTRTPKSIFDRKRRTPKDQRKETETREREKTRAEKKNTETYVTTKAEIEVEENKVEEEEQTSDETAKEPGESYGKNGQQPSEIVIEEVKEHEINNQSDNNETTADDETGAGGKKRPAQHIRILDIKRTATEPFTDLNYHSTHERFSTSATNDPSLELAELFMDTDPELIWDPPPHLPRFGNDEQGCGIQSC